MKIFLDHEYEISAKRDRVINRDVKKNYFRCNNFIFDPALLELEVALAKNVVYFQRNE
jgi:hypothetical protein